MRSTSSPIISYKIQRELIVMDILTNEDGNMSAYRMRNISNGTDMRNPTVDYMPARQPIADLQNIIIINNFIRRI